MNKFERQIIKFTCGVEGVCGEEGACVSEAMPHVVTYKDDESNLYAVLAGHPDDELRAKLVEYAEYWDARSWWDVVALPLASSQDVIDSIDEELIEAREEPED